MNAQCEALRLQIIYSYARPLLTLWVDSKETNVDMKIAHLCLACFLALAWGCQGETSTDLYSDNPAQIKKSGVADEASSAGTIDGEKQDDFARSGTGSTLPTEDGSRGATGSEPFCGDGLIDAGETCDGNCPQSCDDGNTCTVDALVGDAATCDAECISEEISSCIDGDGCCPAACSFEEDDDCSQFCGDGIVDPHETCDGACPTTCDDGDVCTVDVQTGTPEACNVQCGSTDITSCVDGDGCCAPGCTSATDDDCTAICGNDLVEDGEFCDGDCPTSCSDGDACTMDVLVGDPSSCSSACLFDDVTSCVDSDGCCPAGCTSANDDDCSASCGNDFVDSGETCDGDCPGASSCNDGDACTADSLAGSASTCDAQCRNQPISACVSNDGCCAPGCTSANDDDCGAACGNGLIESGETCDGDCPSYADCNDGDACTTDSVSGSANSCTAICVSAPVTACVDGDGCCAPGCTNANDDDCAPAEAVALDCTDPTTWPAAWKALEDEILAETNRRRTAPGGQTCGTTHYPAASTLTFNAKLREAARCHSLDMIENNFFSHSGTDGSRVGIRVDRTGYNWRYVGENLAAGNETAPKIVDQWMRSETHCKNLMKPVYEEIGLGYAYESNTTYKEYSTQVFGTEF